MIMPAHIIGIAGALNLPAFKPECPLAERPDGGIVMRNEKQRSPLIAKAAHEAQAFLLERGVADGEDFIDDQNVGLVHVHEFIGQDVV